MAIILARALARGLAAEVPPGISVSSRAGDVLVSNGVTSDGTSLVPIVDQPGDLEENITSAASAVLNTVQDVVIKHLRTGWPSPPGIQPGAVESGAELPLPTAKAAGRSLRLWFGDPERPALELEPMDLAELIQGI